LQNREGDRYASGMSTIQSPDDHPLWDFTKEFHDRFLTSVVNQPSEGTAGGMLFDAIRELASTDSERRTTAAQSLQDIVHSLFDQPGAPFLRQFAATWGVVLLWDDFHNSFINTGGFHSFESDDERRRFGLGASLISEQEIFTRRGFTEPMTELIFRAAVPPRPLVLAWPRPNSPDVTSVKTVVTSDPSPSAPVYISFAELNDDAALVAGLETLRASIMTRIRARVLGIEDTEWMAEQIQVLALHVLKSSPAVADLMAQRYDTLQKTYGSSANDADRERSLTSSLQTLIWNRLLDEHWEYLYFIPAQLPGPRTVSGLVIACRKELTHPEYTGLLQIVNRVLSVFHFGLYGYQRDRFALQAAVTAIMARNMSHNVGSHILPRTHDDQIRARLLELAPELCQQKELVSSIAGDLRDRLSSFVQSKADFLSEITTEPLTSTRPAMFFQEVIVPLLDNPLILDNLAANEGIRYEMAGSGVTSSRLRIRVFMLERDKDEPVEMAVRYSCAPAVCEQVGCPRGTKLDYVPQCVAEYSGRCPYKRTTPLTPTVLNSENDVQVDLPGPLGEFAFYGFLENLIRNAAKHNRRLLADRGLTIDVTIRDNGDPDFYEIVVSDDVSDPEATRPDGVALHEYLREQLNQTLTDATGQIRRAAWGLREMQVCAALLGGVSDFVTLTATAPLKVHSDHGRLKFAFRLMRSRNVLAFLPDAGPWTAANAKADLQRRGVHVCRSWGELQDALTTAKRRTARFAVFSIPGYGDTEREHEFVAKLELLLPRLPLRVLVFDPLERFSGTTNTLSDVTLPNGVGVIRSSADDAAKWSSISTLMEWLWSAWLDRWLMEQTSGTPVLIPGISVGTERRNVASLKVYLQQRESDEPTRRWVHHANRFNENSQAVHVVIGGQDEAGQYTPLMDWKVVGGPEVMYDRHGDMLAARAAAATSGDVTSYVTLSKDSPDFTPLFSGSFPSGDERWLFPYELAEAGLLRVLVVDERIAESSCEIASDPNGDAAMEKWGKMLQARGAPDEGVLLRRWHIGWLANVFICTHFGFDNPAEPLHPSIARRAAAEPLMPSLSVEIGDRAAFRVSPFNSAAPDDCAPVFDVVLIHQGVLDNWCRGDTRRCLDTLRRHVGAVVVESGRGMPLTLPAGERFLPFSVIQHFLLGRHVGKFGLTRSLMSLARSGGARHV
jgi:hypothetical protein